MDKIKCNCEKCCSGDQENCELSDGKEAGNSSGTETSSETAIFKFTATNPQEFRAQTRMSHFGISYWNQIHPMQYIQSDNRVKRRLGSIIVKTRNNSRAARHDYTRNRNGEVTRANSNHDESETQSIFNKNSKMDVFIENDNNEPIECPCCLRNCRDLESIVTECGHIFCSNCMAKALIKEPHCPYCMQSLGPNGFRRISL